ncbi:MAG: DEAD/DEAH box helicase [Halobacteriales archaeon]
MDAFIEWLTDQPRATDRIQYREHTPARAPQFADLDVHHRVERALDAEGIDQLYDHQVAAIGVIRAGDNAVIATPTASGKSLVYTVPAIERALEAGTRTLYIGPMRALINDQEAAMEAFIDGLGFGPRVELAQYTGQQTQHEKQEIREREPHVLLTTPDMLHLGILPHAHRLWEWLFRSLDLIVIDEIHEYRGIFGSHVALVLRRLARLCERFDASPQYVCCSATIGNPVEHASAVTNEPPESFALVDRDTSATGPRTWLFWNPPRKQRAGDSPDDPADEGSAGGERRSPHPETAQLFCDLLQHGHQTLVFTNSRQTAERYAQRSASLLRDRGETALADAVVAYQAALTQDRRETIEAGLQDGTVRGVWSTNALELGIDVGGLDAVLLDGYPGTRMETHQRAGRAGRGTDPCLVALIGGQDQLDQYLMANPATLFDAAPERAMVNPANEELLPDHIRCAARENWLKPDDTAFFGDAFPDLVSELTADGDLERRETTHGIRWTDAGDEYPQQSVNLRTIDDREIQLIDTGRDETIASLGFGDALRDAHPDAIYYHQGRTYEVAAFQPEKGRALLRETTATYHTRALRQKDITVERELDEKVLDDHADVSVRFAEVTIRERVDGYMRYDGPDDDGTRVEFPEPLPDTEIRTQALYFTIPPRIERTVRAMNDREDGFAGAIHAVEHGMISLFPLELLCDRRDIGGLSTPRHPHTGRSTIFIHDGHPGGVGLARGGFDAVASLLTQTRELISDCRCPAGCPACIQSPHCGNANSPLAKELAVELLDALADEPQPASQIQ